MAAALVDRATAAGADSADAFYSGEMSQSVQVRLTEIDGKDEVEIQEP